ncbi:sulfite oxidase heme-binding subunit YedZ [Alicycliphilus denitrificans]|uniref:sulfite oxidase heme-binding subunit YedZ n=1 Tax=Alicycliphilus denitrificans TaxID=179636 RepID=UPI003A804C6C
MRQARPGGQAAADRALRHPAAKPLLFALCLLPLAWLVYAAAFDRLGANPAEALIRSMGDWTLRLLCLTLAVTPLRLAARLPALARFRRMLGVYTFFYAALHLLCYAWFDMGLDGGEIARDVAKRPFILVGMCGFVLLLVLAATSFNRAMRWLGGRRWQRLHRSVYLVAGLALLHFFWMRAGKNDFAEVAVYAAILAALLLARPWLRRSRNLES